jgi:hypothetical protein
LVNSCMCLRSRSTSSRSTYSASPCRLCSFIL